MGPGLTQGNMMYAARRAGSSDLAVVIRGTDWRFVADWIENGEVLKLVPFPYAQAADPNIRIATGTMTGLADLIGMTATSSGAASGTAVGLSEFINAECAAAGAPVTVYVTGHSLGGCLATVVPLWLKALVPKIRICVYSYAGPTAGNASFAQYWNEMLPDGLYHVYNDHDIVPRGWNELGLPTHWYDPRPPCPISLAAVADGLQVVLDHDVYTQAGISVPLPSKVFAADEASYWQQVAYQHDPNTYLSLLAAAPVHATQAAMVRAATGPAPLAKRLAVMNPFPANSRN
jgi:hypothetical protein